MELAGVICEILKYSIFGSQTCQEIKSETLYENVLMKR